VLHVHGLKAETTRFAKLAFGSCGLHSRVESLATYGLPSVAIAVYLGQFFFLLRWLAKIEYKRLSPSRQGRPTTI